MISTTDKQDLANIFIWGTVGERLKRLDEKRLLAIAQDKPHYYLSVIANDEIDKMIRVLAETGEFNDEIKKTVRQINERDNIFRQITKFLHNSDDMLSTGSFIVGDLPEKTAMLRLMSEGE